MYSNTRVFAAAAITGLGAVALFSPPASAQAGYCYYHPHDPVCLAGVVAPYVAHHAYHEHYDEHYDDHYHHHHDHDHDHDHHHHDHDHDHNHH